MKTPRIIAALVLSAFCLPAFAAAPAQPYRYAPPADWVRVAAELPLAAAAVEQGQSDYLLVDHQVRLSKVAAHYQRYVERLVSQSAVDDGAQISIEIDPEYERVLLHEVRVFRDGHAIDKLADSRRSLLNREEELEDRLINGRVTLHVLLQDVRVGDVLDYSYTVERTDPFGERSYSDWFSAQWATPVRRFRLRILRPTDRPLRVLDHSNLAPPQETRAGAWTEITWEAKDIAALESEDGKPAWFIQYPRIEISEFADWDAVRAWTLPMYRVQPGKDRAFDAFVTQLRTEPDEAARILKALRLVQDDIRYTGLEMGAGAYRPTQPSVVLARRYGDCKDKVLLFVTILRALGIEAHPALVHSRIGRGLEQRLPRPSTFDHVIAKVRWKNRDYWLDTTASGQGGDLDTLVQADFKLALLLAPGAHGLESIPARDGERPAYSVVETYDFREGTGKPASFQVLATYRDEEADSMRATMLTNTATQLSKDYLDYYRRSYPGVRATKPLVIKDDRARNLFTVEENYTIDTPFEKNDDGESEIVLEAYLVSDRTGEPKLIERTTPLARKYPSHVRHQIVAYLPGNWNIEDEARSIRDPAFEYSSRTHFRKGRLELNYELRNIRDHVPVDQLKDFLKKLDRAHDDSFFTLTAGEEAATPVAAAQEAQAGPSIEFILALVMGSGLGAWLAVFLWNFDPRLRERPADAPVGLVGWMVLVVIGVCLGPIFAVQILVEWCAAIGTDAAFRAQGTTLQYLYVALTLTLGAVLVASFLLPVLMFRKRSSFPLAYVASQILWVVVTIVTCIAVVVHPGIEEIEKSKQQMGLVFAMTSAGLWIAYILVSRRVRATFVRDSSGGYARNEPAAAAGA